jgi:hypothetical protein
VLLLEFYEAGYLSLKIVSNVLTREVLGAVGRYLKVSKRALNQFAEPEHVGFLRAMKCMKECTLISQTEGY